MVAAVSDNHTFILGNLSSQPAVWLKFVCHTTMSDMDPVICLLNACNNGDLWSIKQMIERDKVVVNVTATFRLPGFSHWKLKDASPLFISARNGDAKVCQYLVDMGANVNHLTTVKSKSGTVFKFTALHEAIKRCSFRDPKYLEGLKATMELLLANGADLSILPVVNGIARPMWTLSSIFDVSLTMLLIDLGLISPSLPLCPAEGLSVLHRWALVTENSIPIFKNLLGKGADVNVIDKFGLTPLNVAAIGGYPGSGPLGNPNEHVLGYLLDERNDNSLLDKIEALKLAGSSILLFNEDQLSIDRAFNYWYQAQELQDSAEKPIIVPYKSFHWRSVEWSTRNELDQLRLRPLASIKMQAFLVTRRVLGRISSNFFVPFLWTEFVSKHFSFATLYNENRFAELLDISWLMLDGINDCQEPDRAEDEYWKIVIKVNHWLVETLTKLKNMNSPILNLDTFEHSLKLVFNSNYRPLLLESTYINQSGTSVDALPLQILYHLMYTVVCPSPEMITPEVRSLLVQLVKRDVRDSVGYNLLLMACYYYSTFDTLPTIRLLLELDADPNVKNRGGFTPLHFAAYYMEQGEMYSTLADLLLEYDAHLDHTDLRQGTPLDVWKERNAGEAGEVLSPPAWLNPVLSLKCYCARAIKRSNILCEEEQLPIKSLRDFVAEH